MPAGAISAGSCGAAAACGAAKLWLITTGRLLLRIDHHDVGLLLHGLVVIAAAAHVHRVGVGNVHRPARAAAAAVQPQGSGPVHRGAEPRRKTGIGDGADRPRRPGRPRKYHVAESAHIRVPRRVTRAGEYHVTESAGRPEGLGKRARRQSNGQYCTRESSHTAPYFKVTTNY